MQQPVSTGSPPAPAGHWPADGLETLGRCPVCGSAERRKLYDGLTDAVFFVAPGRWTLWRCGDCRSGYLDPRPDRKTIGLAYGRYYTHEEEQASAPALAPATWRTALGNGYRNSRYGAGLSPTSRLGPIAAALAPSFRSTIDIAHRHLPHPASVPLPTVLDVGCGGGEWLQVARDLGWTARGAEPDEKARERAVARGFDVRLGSAEAWADEAGRFGAVTMSHVVEHLHDPVETLRTIHALLAPGGRLYIDTPNIDAASHALFGRHWRGLEVPRHLVIFNPRSLRRAARAAGFARVRHVRRASPAAWLNQASARIAAGADPYDEAAGVPAPPVSADQRRANRVGGARAEFITLVCDKA